MNEMAFLECFCSMLELVVCIEVIDRNRSVTYDEETFCSQKLYKLLLFLAQ